jgi:pimeloyl-ACP methyl ester carboxylesterase
MTDSPSPGSLPVVLLHAFPLHSGMWEPQMELFADRVVLAPDLPGFGAREPGARDLDGFARTALQAMDGVGVDRAVVVGLSMGGYVAFRIHALAPERVAGMVLADTQAGPDDEAGRAKRTDQARQARKEGVEWMPELLIPALLGETTLARRPEVAERVRGMIRTADPEGVARALEAMRERPDSTTRLGKIRVPVLSIVGEEDTLTPPDRARAIADGVPDGRMVRIPGAGHLSNLEDPAAFNRALIGFLS